MRRKAGMQLQLQNGYIPAITASPNPHGIGYKWILFIAEKRAGQIIHVRRFLLGQDEKVSNRVLGQRLADLRPYKLIRHIDNSASLRIKQRIARELIAAYGGNAERLFRQASESDLAVE